MYIILEIPSLEYRMEEIKFIGYFLHDRVENIDNLCSNQKSPALIIQILCTLDSSTTFDGYFIPKYITLN